MRTFDPIRINSVYDESVSAYDEAANAYEGGLVYGDYGFFLERARAFMHKDKIKEAFKSVWGREPTDNEILQVATAYEWNKSHLGDRLKDPTFVKWVQSAVNIVLGKPKVKVDGIFGYQTIAGIMLAQKLKGMKVNGFLDQPTLMMLAAAKKDKNLSLAKEDIYTGSSGRKTWLYILIGAAIAGIAAYIILKGKE